MAVLELDVFIEGLPEAVGRLTRQHSGATAFSAT